MKMEKTLTFVTDDGNTCTCPLSVVSYCGTFKDMLEDIGTDCDIPEAIPVPAIKRVSILRKALEFAVDLEKHEKDVPPPSKEVIADWEIEKYFRTNQVDLFDLVVAANFLNFTILFEHLCDTIAAMLRDKSAQEVRDMFGIKDSGFTKEEEEQIRKENEWYS